MDIPVDKKGGQVYGYTYIKQVANQLKLDSLEAGFDSLQIRILMLYSFAEHNHMLELKRQDDEWTSKLYSYRRRNVEMMGISMYMNI